ncbi:MAG TPA: glucosamine-6-phosphate synthase, partial [Acidimicrobiales bacterium]|nr:glucosamine-6-phosphate synthase [Acidimicrobiales bacterium]
LVVTDAPLRYPEALDVIGVPVVHPRLAFVLSTMVGHLFGYEAALAIDAQALPLREAHAAIEQAAAGELDASPGGQAGDALVDAVRERILPCAGRFNDELRSGRLNGHLEAATAVRLASLFRYALGDVPLESYQREFGRVGTPALVLDDLASALTVAIEELTRPVDAIKHQAKTVTVGISRTDETLLEARLTRAVLDAGAPRDGLSYRTLRLLMALDPAVAEITGFTRYRLDDVEGSTPIAAIVDRGGVSTGIPSRTERDPALRGTKHRVAVDREVLVTRGARDDRTIVLVPEVKDAEAVGLTLLHITTVDRLSPDTVRSVLEGYHNRYGEIRDAVCETEPSLRDDLLVSIPVEDLLIDEVGAIADRLRNRS